jgi:hypothetical protein
MVLGTRKAHTLKADIYIKTNKLKIDTNEDVKFQHTNF